MNSALRRSRWRETEFMLREIRSAILPPWPWTALLRKWPEIVAQLAESPRRRQRYSYY
jgi:hypothetical protein